MGRAERQRNNLVTAQGRHYMRYLRHDQGESVEDIARTEGVGVVAVERSIATVRLQRGMNSQQNLNTAVVGMLMGNMKRATKTMQRMLDAKNYIEHRQEDGSTKLVPIDNPKVQLKALEIFSDYVGSVQPRQPGTNIKVQQNNANAAVTHTNAKSGGYEEVLHGIIGKVRQANQLPYQTTDVIEAEEDEEEGEGEDE